MNNIIFQKPDGGVTITRFTKEALQHIEIANEYKDMIASGDEIDAEILAEMQRQIDFVANNIGFTPEEHATILSSRLNNGHKFVAAHPEIPSDYYFRDAWTFKDGFVTIDMDKAREVHKEKLRALRIPLLDALDVAYQRKDESGDAAGKAAIAKKKQALRDITKHPDIESAKTPEELKDAAIRLLSLE